MLEIFNKSRNIKDQQILKVSQWIANISISTPRMKNKLWIRRSMTCLIQTVQETVILTKNSEEKKTLSEL